MFCAYIDEPELIKVLDRYGEGGYVLIYKNLPQHCICEVVSQIPNYFKIVSSKEILMYLSYKALHGHDEAYTYLQEYLNES